MPSGIEVDMMMLRSCRAKSRHAAPTCLDFARHERVWVAVAASLLAATPAIAQPPKEPTTYDRAIAAGYKALTLCSGIFNAGRTQAQIEALELKGIYPEYDAIVPTLTAQIFDGEGPGSTDGVSVPFAERFPPRTAILSEKSGCGLRPLGEDSIVVTSRELAGPRVPRRTFDDVAWPSGDENARTLAPSLQTAIAKPAASKPYGEGSETTAVVVVKRGRIVAEHYREGFDLHTSQRTWSVAKSIAGTFLGYSTESGALSLTERTGIPEWQRVDDPRQAITLDNLLRMASGLHSATAGNRTDAIYFGGTSVTEEATAWPLEALPGARFRYANNDTLLAVRSLRARLGDEAYTRLPREFFEKIGMTRTIAETDWQGNFILSSQVWSTARDLARFGMLYLDDGVWEGERILPEGWRRYVTTPSGPQPDGPFGYGAGFWLMNKSPGIPADTFAAFGNRGQYVVIVPSRDVVIVRRGEDPHGSRFDIAKFTADILAALE